MSTPVDVSVEIVHGDVPLHLLHCAGEVGTAAIDIETTGLDWRIEQIATVQVFVPGCAAAIVRIVPGERPAALCQLLEDEWVTKVFHHAMFDLRFMAHAWAVAPASIQCTKIAAKLADPEGEHSLQALVRRHVGVELDKSQQLSNWMTASLSDEQQAYAVADVVHLPHVVELQQKDLRAAGLWSLASRCFAHIPTRVELETRGIADPFTY